jgi:hypothetical protein
MAFLGICVLGVSKSIRSLRVSKIIYSSLCHVQVGKVPRASEKGVTCKWDRIMGVDVNKQV